jgi:hypothetical protein
MYDLNLIKRCNLPIMMSAIMMRDGRLCFMLIQATIRHKGSVSSIAKLSVQSTSWQTWAVIRESRSFVILDEHHDRNRQPYGVRWWSA